MFNINADFNLDDINSYIEDEMNAWLEELVEELRWKGKEFVKRARSKVQKDGKVFNNITWNLVSSMGYCLVQNNKIVESYFPPAKAGTTGEATGLKFAEGVVYETPIGPDEILLVLVAGEHYAHFLKTKNYDVIKSSSAHFEAELTALWK